MGEKGDSFGVSSKEKLLQHSLSSNQFLHFMAYKSLSPNGLGQITGCTPPSVSRCTRLPVTQCFQRGKFGLGCG